MKRKIDPKVFDTDPKFAGQRDIFDALVQGSIRRAKKTKITKDEPSEDEPAADDVNFFDAIFGIDDKKEDEDE